MISRSLLAAVALACMLPSSAHACEPLPQARYWVLPSGVGVPVNTRIFTGVETEWGSAPALDPKSLELQPKVALEAQVFQTGDTAFVELTPKQKLAKKTRYQIYGKLGKQRTRVGSFVTGDQQDLAPPTWSGFEARAYPASKLAGGGSCWSQRAGVRMRPKDLREGHGQMDRLLFLVTVIDKRGGERRFIRNLDADFDPILGSELGWQVGEIDLAGPYERIGEDFGPTFLSGGSIDLVVTPIDIAGNRGSERRASLSIPAPL